MKAKLLLMFCLSPLFGLAQQVITETMGSVSSTTSISAHELANGFDQDWLTYSGSGDMRTTSTSSGYTGASGGANVFLTADTPNKDFIISGLKPNSSCGTITLSFGAFKSTSAATNTLIVEYTTSTNSSYTSAGTISLGTGSNWTLISGISLPLNVNTIRFTNSNASGTQFRIDDVTISGTGTGCSLPVKLVSFEGKALEQGIQLNWATSWEEKNEGFDILKGQTPDGLEKIGFVEGHSTTQNASDYSFTDHEVKAGQVYYYRLRQRDIGGATDLSKMIAVRADFMTAVLDASVYPNPNQGNFTVSTGGLELATISLYNLLGAVMPVTIKENEKPGLVLVNTAGTLSPGIYHLYLQTRDGLKKQSIKVIVN